MTMIPHSCRECGATFSGGPTAKYCPLCRAERKRQEKIRYLERKKLGKARELGSIDICKNCSKPFVVAGSPQIYCPECGPMLRAEKDAEQGLRYYHSKQETINPARNAQRRKGTRQCIVCGKEFESTTRRLTCSHACAREHINRGWRERYYKHKGQDD